MTTQLLIYERAAAVSSERHRDWCVRADGDFAFAKHVNSVPLTAVEFPNAAAEYAIVFTGNEDAVMPAVILGARDKENLYITESGWDAKYVPAFLRRYPFVFSSGDEGDRFTLCIDEEFSGCNQEGRGERLFDADGNQTQYLTNVLEFLKAYQAHFQQTQAFCAKLKELELLEPMQAQFTPPGGTTMSLTGFMAISRDKLKALPADKLAELAKTDELELMYLHLQSMRNVVTMAQRLGGENAGETPEGGGSPL